MATFLTALFPSSLRNRSARILALHAQIYAKVRELSDRADGRELTLSSHCW